MAAALRARAARRALQAPVEKAARRALRAPVEKAARRALRAPAEKLARAEVAARREAEASTAAPVEARADTTVVPRARTARVERRAQVGQPAVEDLPARAVRQALMAASAMKMRTRKMISPATNGRASYISCAFDVFLTRT
jgi:hypothetical protein